MANNLFGGNICKGNHIKRAFREHVSSEVSAFGGLHLIFYHNDKKNTFCQSVVVPLCLQYEVHYGDYGSVF